jgi:hypothetical protein
MSRKASGGSTNGPRADCSFEIHLIAILGNMRYLCSPPAPRAPTSFWRDRLSDSLKEHFISFMAPSMQEKRTSTTGL